MFHVKHYLNVIFSITMYNITIQASLSGLVNGRTCAHKRQDTRGAHPYEQVERRTPSGGRWFCADRSEAKKLGLRVR